MDIDEQKSARLDARLPESVLVMIRRAADLQGRSLSEFVVSSAREAAENTISQHEILNLSAQDQKRFAELLLSPPPVAKAMKKAARRHKRLVEADLGEPR